MLKSENRMNNKGFSLVEVIVAIAILALVTAPFLSSFVSATKNNERSQYQIKAKQSGEAVIEAFKGSSMSYLVSEYGLTEKTDATGKGTGVYTTTLTSSNFSGLGTNYTAEVLHLVKITMVNMLLMLVLDIMMLIKKYLKMITFYLLITLKYLKYILFIVF